MNNITKKITAITLLFTIFFFAQSNRAEANPAVIVPGVIALGTVLFVAGAVKYSAPTTSAPNVMTNLGTLGRLSVATWSAATQYGVEQFNNKMVTLKTSFQQLINEVVTPTISGNTLLESPYPALRSALLQYPTGTGTMHPVSVNEVLKVGNNWYKVDSLNYNYHWAYNPLGQPTYNCNGMPQSDTQFCYAYDPAPQGDYLGWQVGYWHIVDPPAPSPKTLSQLLAERSANPTSPPVYADPSVASDIDRLIAAKPSMFTAVDTIDAADTDNAPVWYPPPAALPVGVKPPTTTLPTSTAAQAAAQAAAAKVLTEGQAQAAVDAYKAAHPGATGANDPVLNNLEKALEAAKSAAAAANELAAQTSAEADVPLPEAKADSLKAIDFSPFLGLQGILSSKFPFTLLSSIHDYLTVFTSSTIVAPVIRIPVFGSFMVIDLSFMDSAAAVSRYLIASLMAVGTVFYIVRRYTD